MNKERILKLADVMQKIAEGEIEGVYNQNEYTHSCGSPSCIAGWAVHLFSSVEKKKIKKHKEIYSEAKNVLELSTSQAYDLFKGLLIYKNKRPRIPIPDPRAKKPEIAAEMLRYFSETYEVDWNIAEEIYNNKSKHKTSK